MANSLGLLCQQGTTGPTRSEVDRHLMTYSSETVARTGKEEMELTGLMRRWIMELMRLNETLNREMNVEQAIALINSTHSGFMSLHDICT